ncbi:MAG: Primosomal protein N [Candidatus Nomurabacteria bacterium GW2011_GWA2_35_80]|uniref:Primosomal protein N n=1 Tax=Candidatus Nomurabacteria bacterium GW2011_GWA2_35_80 TaxID=1618733 RepID=A0A0G0FJR1_9BACT|nr:MAG: Primosomal protein N [Candidatus Nomurabacteria bacterium GW2011_GWA2_35_80]
MFPQKISFSEKKDKKELTNASENIKTEKLLLQAQLEDRISFYKTLIRGYFALKKSVFIVLPTEYDIEIFQQALSKGIENFTFSMHGGLKPKKIIEKYEQIVNSAHGVLILGTAQYLSIPRTDLGAIIVEHENSDVYKMFPRPHFDLRIFAEVYASKINVKFILADTLLRYETIARKEIDGLSEVYPLSFRTNFDEAMINIVNPNPHKEEEAQNSSKNSFKIFSEKSIEEIQHSLKNKKNIFIFSLRKGLATHTICKDCNETINCEKCLAPVVLYLSRDNKKRMFVCNKCNTEKEPEIKCANCGGWNLMPLGIGTDTVLAEIKNKFPKIKIFKLNRESVKTDKEAEKITKEFEKNSGSILVGTEMAFFYLKAKVDLSIVASFDSLWSIPNFKMSEKIIQLLLSILSKTEKKLIIQTKNKNDPALLAVKSENLLHFIREELEDRKNLNYPPFKRFIKITFLGDKTESIKARQTLKELLKEYNPEIFSGFVPKNKNQYVTNALIKIETKKWSLPELSVGSSVDQNLKNLLSSLPPSFEVSVDPENLL